MSINEVATVTKFSTHKLFYDIDRMGPKEDLVALKRTVFVLTQSTFPPAFQTV